MTSSPHLKNMGTLGSVRVKTMSFVLPLVMFCPHCFAVVMKLVKLSLESPPSLSPEGLYRRRTIGVGSGFGLRLLCMGSYS